jgi:hypothetical protein
MCSIVEIVPPLSGWYLHYFCIDFEFDSHWAEMVEVVEIFFV